MADQANNKRQKLSCSLSNINDLPDETLAKVADFLPKPSRALFALAMTGMPLSAWREGNHGGQLLSSSSMAASKAILFPPSPSQDDHSDQISGRWEELDFSKIEKSLASKLTDDHLSGILICIDAANTLKRLKLGGCVDISGIGLEPLRGSTVLDQIDLCLAGPNESTLIKPEPSISEEAVLPILTNIVENESNRLKHIQIPVKWSLANRPTLARFIEIYTHMMRNRNPSCHKCELPCENRHLTWILSFPTSYYELQSYTCAKCIEYCCYRRTCEAKLKTCYKCRHEYCGACVTMAKCINCNTNACRECEVFKKCNLCGEDCCNGCYDSCKFCERAGCDECINLERCENEGCDKANCGSCYDGDMANVTTCNSEDCDISLCFDCRWTRCSMDWEHACLGCLEMVSRENIPKLLQENKELRKELEKLRQENESLRKK